MVKNIYRKILIVVLVISLAMIFFENASAITGHAAQGTARSEVTITSYLSIQMSANLTDGIIFEEVSILPATNVNASLNYNGTGSSTLYFINVSTDSNTAVDFCLKANQGLETSGADLIGLGNETYSTGVTTSNMTIPDLALDVAMTTSYDKTASNIGIGEANYYRFWLDIPAGQASGTYNNSVSFRGVNLAAACGS